MSAGMKWKLKQTVANVLTPNDVFEVEAAINTLTQANFSGQGHAYTALLTLQSDLFELVPGPKEEPNEEPL